MVVAAEGKYRFKVATGRYQYFRVRVPPRFEGGFLEARDSPPKRRGVPDPSEGRGERFTLRLASARAGKRRLRRRVFFVPQGPRGRI